MSTHELAGHRCAPGRFKHTKALRAALGAAGVRAPHTGEPWSEAMLLGLGGGLGAGYILWEFKAHRSAVLTLGFHHRWNYAQEWYDNACRRVGAQVTWLQTGGRRRADKALDAALRNGHLPVCWVDEFHMPYLHVSERFEGCFGWVAPVFAADEDTVWVDEVWGQPFAVPRAAFADARARIGSYKHRQLTLAATGAPPPLATTVREAIADHVDYLGGPSTSFGLGALRKWGRTVADARGAKGWRRVFADRTRLASVTRSMREGIALRGMDGAGLRGLYADFLREAGAALDDERLTAVADRYDELAERWAALSVAPTDGLPAVAGLHAALDARFAALASGEGIAEASAALEQLCDGLDTRPPWSAAEQDALFSALSEQIQALWLVERQAVAALRTWLTNTPA